MAYNHLISIQLVCFSANGKEVRWFDIFLFLLPTSLFPPPYSSSDDPRWSPLGDLSQIDLEYLPNDQLGGRPPLSLAETPAAPVVAGQLTR